MNYIIGSICERTRVVAAITKEHDDVGIRVREMPAQALTCIEGGNRLDWSFKETLNSIKELEKKASSLKDEVVAASD